MNDKWLIAAKKTVAGYRNLIDSSLGQLTDDELKIRIHPEANSVAIILRHLGGNLYSRWTDFLTTDGEKPDRNRDAEFQDWMGDRQSLMAHFDKGWNALTNALGQINESNIAQIIHIRGEEHSIPQAVTRSITHVSYHAGQIALISRLVHTGHWKWLTISPGQSKQHNNRTWGTAASRSVMGTANEPVKIKRESSD